MRKEEKRLINKGVIKKSDPLEKRTEYGDKAMCWKQKITFLGMN